MATTRLYFRNIAATNTSDLPTAGAKTHANALTGAVNKLGISAGAADEKLALLTTKGSAQTSRTFTNPANTSTTSVYVARYTSLPLMPVTLPGANGNFYSEMLAGSVSSTNLVMNQGLVVYIWRPSTQSVVSYMEDCTGSGSQFNTTTEIGAGVSVGPNSANGSGTDTIVLQGDVLVVERWMNGQSGMATSYTVTDYFDGATEPTSSAAVSNAATYIDIPAALQFYAGPPINTLVDDFNGATLDAAKWTATADSGTSVGVGSGHLKLTVNAAASVFATTAITGVGRYNAKNSSLFFRIANKPTTSTSPTLTLAIQAYSDATTYYRAILNSTSTNLQFNIANANNGLFQNSVTDTTSAFGWLRIRSDALDTIYLDTAPSTAANPPKESDWVNRFSYANATPITESRAYICVTAQGSSPTSVTELDGLNTGETIYFQTYWGLGLLS